MKTNLIYTLLLFFMLLFSAGCSTKSAKPNVILEVHEQQLALASVTHWKLYARIGLRSKHRSGSGTLIWEESPTLRSLRLLGPLGSGVMQLQQDANGVSISDNKGQVYLGSDAGKLVYEVTGWQMPVSGLRWWLLGLAEPETIAIPVYDKDDRLIQIDQDGWRITMKNYTQFGQYELPSSLLIETLADKSSARYLRVKVIIKDWQDESR